MLEIQNKLREYRKQDIDKFKYFHKTGEGEYASKDEFLCITVPDIRGVAKQEYKDTTFDDIQILLDSKYHEDRLCGLIILVFKYKKSDLTLKEKIVAFYLNNTHNINGWDLVDLSAPYIIGEYVFQNPDKAWIIYNLAESDNMWEQRISIVANWSLIRKGEFKYLLEIADKHIATKYDLIQKALGWMLREVGKRDFEVEYNFLKTRYKKMPRTMLRYSIEKFDEGLRQKFLKGEI